MTKIIFKRLSITLERVLERRFLYCLFYELIISFHSESSIKYGPFLSKVVFI